MRFLLVDRIIELEPGRSIRAEKTLPASEELFRDHFPGFPVVPGVLLTEMMAQTAGKCLNAQRLPRGAAMLIEIRNARFRTWAKPDQLITLDATVESNLEAVATARCSASVEGRKICSAELLFAFMPLTGFATDYRDEVLESYLAGKK
jgi:3-hydroxyacyl-[acyl-carrier-protein] dehydratase